MRPCVTSIRTLPVLLTMLSLRSITTQNRIPPPCHILSGMGFSCSTFSIVGTHSPSDILRAFQFCDVRFQQQQSLILYSMSFYTKILNHFPQ